MKRARPANKPQYLRIQAHTLVETGDKVLAQAALELLDQSLRDFPDQFFGALVHRQRADCLRVLGRLDDAFLATEQALTAEEAEPNLHSSAYLVFAELVVESRRAPLVERALQLISKHAVGLEFPSQRFAIAAAAARLCAISGDRAGSRANARVALEAAEQSQAPYPRHPGVGLVDHPDSALLAELTALAQ